MRYLNIAVAVLLSFISTLAFSEDAPRLDQLIVYGQGFSFGVKEPPGWTGDTQNANHVGANVLFYRATENLNNVGALIRVRLSSKTDEDTTADLKYDMNEYRTKYPKIQFVEFEATHPSYRIFPKLFLLQGEFSEYVAYLNPGPTTPFLISASMNKQRGQATTEEIEAFRLVVKSITFLTTNVKN